MLYLKYIASYAFGNCCTFIYGTFLDYDEWLRYTDRQDVTYNSYIDYLMNVSDFNNTSSLELYLKSCIDETLLCCKNCYKLVPSLAMYSDSDIDSIINNAISLLYVNFLLLHNSICNRADFTDLVKLARRLRRVTGDSSTIIKSSVFDNAIRESIVTKLPVLDSLTDEALRKALMFLIQFDFIVICHVGTSSDNNACYDFIYNNANSLTVSQFLQEYVICVKHPIFSVLILKDIVSRIDGCDLRSQLSNDVLGSIVECHVRGLLSYLDKSDFQDVYFASMTQQAVDYINYTNKVMYEISCGTKSEKNVHFDAVPNADLYDKYVINGKRNDGNYRLFYKWIYDTCSKLFC